MRRARARLLARRSRDVVGGSQLAASLAGGVLGGGLSRAGDGKKQPAQGPRRRPRAPRDEGRGKKGVAARGRWGRKSAFRAQVATLPRQQGRRLMDPPPVSLRQASGRLEASGGDGGRRAGQPAARTSVGLASRWPLPAAADLRRENVAMRAADAVTAADGGGDLKSGLGQPLSRHDGGSSRCNGPGSTLSAHRRPPSASSRASLGSACNLGFCPSLPLSLPSPPSGPPTCPPWPRREPYPSPSALRSGCLASARQVQHPPWPPSRPGRRLSNAAGVPS